MAGAYAGRALGEASNPARPILMRNFAKWKQCRRCLSPRERAASEQHTILGIAAMEAGLPTLGHAALLEPHNQNGGFRIKP